MLVSSNMIQILKLALLILSSVVLQTTLVAHISIFGSRPDLPLALTISIALFKGSLHGESIGFVSGLMCDLSSGSPFIGIQSFSKVLIGYSTGFLRERFYSDNLLTQLLSGFIATLADKLISLLILGILLAGLPFPRIRIPGLILTSIINSLFVVMVFKILGKIFKKESQWN